MWERLISSVVRGTIMWESLTSTVVRGDYYDKLQRGLKPFFSFFPWQV